MFGVKLYGKLDTGGNVPPKSSAITEQLHKDLRGLNFHSPLAC